MEERNEIEIFRNEDFGEIRTVVIDDEPWFVAKDVCNILEIGNPSQALSRLENDERDTIILNEGIGNPEKSIVSESGFYAMVLGSRKQIAKPFRLWVTREVIPSIRKHGAYMTEDTLEKALTSPDFLIQLATQLKQEQEARKLAEIDAANKAQIIEEQKPLVDFANHVTESSDSIDMGEFAKVVKKENIEIGRNRLFEWLRHNGYLMSNNVPYQKYVENNYFKVIETTKDTAYGSRVFTKTLVTGKGQIAIVEKLRKELCD